MGLREAMAAAQQYGQQKPLGPDIEAPPMPQQLPMIGAPQQSGGNQMMNMGTKLLGSYLNRKKPAADAPLEGGGIPVQRASSSFAPNFQGPSALSLPGMWAGGSDAPYIGKPVLMGEEGPETIQDNEGNEQVVGQQGPQVVVPQEPAMVTPNPVSIASAVRQRWAGGQPATPESSGVTNDTTANRARIAQPADYLRTKIAEDTLAKPVDHNGRLKSGLLSAALGALQGASNGGGWRGALGGAVGGGVAGAVNPAFDEQQMQNYQTAGDQRDLQQLDANQQAGLAGQMRKAQIAGQYGNIGYKAGQLDVARQNSETRKTAVSNRADIEQNKIDLGYDKLDYAGKRDLANRVARTFNDAKEFDPDDPKNAKAVAAMEASGITPFKKTANSPAKYIQDPDTGQWFIGKGGAISTAKGPDGQDFKTTAPHLMDLDKIKAQAAAAEARATTKEGKKSASDKVFADAFGASIDSYNQMATEAESRGDAKGAASAKTRAIAAEREARKHGWTPPVVHRPR